MVGDIVPQFYHSLGVNAWEPPQVPQVEITERQLMGILQ
jgi:hypothetical protein